MLAEIIIGVVVFILLIALCVRQSRRRIRELKEEEPMKLPPMPKVKAPMEEQERLARAARKAYAEAYVEGLAPRFSKKPSSSPSRPVSGGSTVKTTQEEVDIVTPILLMELVNQEPAYVEPTKYAEPEISRSTVDTYSEPSYSSTTSSSSRSYSYDSDYGSSSSSSSYDSGSSSSSSSSSWD